ncbi:ABC transporter permease [Paenibacillus sp. N1-5-1-14]|uniref:ABC transporter permease n=1 Tax=Paenibacillus radicibacter TaxID=2972488 RepID=UPI002158DD05|nr:ABC transporter permease [Paenibacillus radicibacter]MCR8645700.1 ABC transporter permease [Paenibacillus radicibacter]
MNVKQLFLHRIRYNASFQRRVISLVIDWIIALYFVVPAVLIGGYQYFVLWKQPPAWFAFLPIVFVFFIMKLLGSVGNNRYFIEGADQLFILQRDQWYKKIIQYGFLFSLGKRLIMMCLIVFLFAPWLYAQLGFGGLQLASLVIGGTLFIFIEKIILERISYTYRGWKYYFIRIPFVLMGIALFIGFGYVVTYLPWLGLGMTLVMLVLLPSVRAWRVSWKGTFFEQVDREVEMKTRLLSLMMKQVDDKKKPTRRKRPILFRQSNRLFRKYTPVKGVAESLIKVFTRDSGQVGLYLRLAIPISAAMLVVPLFAKWILWGAAIFVLKIWMRSWAKNALQADFLQLFSLSDRFRHDVVLTTSYWLALPGLLVISALGGISAFGWMGLVGGVAATGVIHYTLNRWMYF